MPGKQLSISRSKALTPVIELAMEKWPASKSEAAALTSALMRWFYDQQGDSRKAVAERTDKKLDAIIDQLARQEELESYNRIEAALLDIREYLRGSHDNDHG